MTPTPAERYIGRIAALLLHAEANGHSIEVIAKAAIERAEATRCERTAPLYAPKEPS